MFAKTYKVGNTRRYKRLRASYLVRYRAVGSENESNVSNIKDISAGGIRFWTERFYPEGTLLSVSFWVPPLERTMEVVARVLRVRQARHNQGIFYVAASFVEFSQGDQTALDRLVEALAQIQEGNSLVFDAYLVKRTVSTGPSAQ